MAILDPAERNRRIREVQARYLPGVTDFSHETGKIYRPSGHANGIQLSIDITSQFRRVYRSGSMNVTPVEVVNILVAANVKSWVLMGLHGYVGYLAEPRATQGVDIMIALEEQGLATDAIQIRWPDLEVQTFPVVVRFIDPVDRDSGKSDGHVIDLMRPNNDCQFAILAKFFRIDEETGHRIPTLEAAMASKYAALASPNRKWDRKQQDAVDLRMIISPNYQNIDKKTAHALGEKVFPGGGDELLEFIQLAIDEKPFPV